MFKNYLSIALRNLLRNKAFSVINILGLSIGISSALVIYLIAYYDFSYDKFEPGGDRIYRVVMTSSYQGNIDYNRAVAAPLGEVIRKEVSGLEEVSTFRYYQVGKTMVPAAGKPAVSSFHNQQDVIWADGHYFNLLPYHWLAGSPRTALEEPGRVVLDETRARLYFPHLSYQDIIGKLIIYDDTIRATVSGVVADLQSQGNTDFTFQEFVSLRTLIDNKGLVDQYNWDQWGSTSSDHEVYVRLAAGVKPAVVDAQLHKVFNKYNGQPTKPTDHIGTYLLQPLQDIHFNDNYGIITGDVASTTLLYGLMLVAGFLLLLGCINFINLTTAQAVQRAKEIGIRKTMGSSRRQLIWLFLGETFLVTLLATGLSLLLTPLLLRTFADFIPKGVHFSISQPYLLAFGVLLVCAVSLLAGFYPALVLSSWQPVKVLKSQVYSGGGNQRVRVRQTLTVFQFVIAQVFVIATALVGKQISYLLSKDLGFRQQAILSFDISDTSFGRRVAFVHELQQIPGIGRVSLAYDVPSSGTTWSTTVNFDNGKGPKTTSVELKFGDTNYLPLFQIPLLAGRAVQPSDTIREVVINEVYLHELGFQRPQDALGKVLQVGRWHPPIVGVMRNFLPHPLNITSLKVSPMLFSEAFGDCRKVIVELPAATDGRTNWKPVIAQLEARYKAAHPDEDFNYSFFDESIARFYDQEQKLSRLLTWATGITVFISCLGLLGLVIYTTKHRKREIGVRKVLGASVSHIVSILSLEFVKLVVIAFLVAMPIAWWGLHQWLDNFTLRTSLSWWVFAGSGLGMVLVAFLTLGVQTVRTARANPINSLRTE